MAGVATAVGRHRLQASEVAAVALVVHQRPGTIERRRPEIIRAPAHGIAGGVTDAAIDAFDAGVGGAARRAVGLDPLDVVVARLRRREDAVRLLPLLEEGPHVGHQILDDGEILQWPDLEPAALGHLGHVGAAGPARTPVHGHGTGAAHADPAREAIGERRVEVALNEGHHVEHGLIGELGNPVGLISPLPSSPPQGHGQLGSRFGFIACHGWLLRCASLSCRAKPGQCKCGVHRRPWRADEHWHRPAHSLPSTPQSTIAKREKPMRRNVLVLGLLAVAIAGPALAQDRYPTRPVRLAIPAVAGGVHDVIGRVWAEKIKPHFGTVVIDNRGGGGGLIAATDVARSAPDGYSLLMGSTTTHVLITAVLANPPYDPVKDFSAVTVFAYSSTSVVVHPSVPARTLAELIAYAKANPGKLSYGSAGNGSITNLAGELFKQRAGALDIVHVPYKGIGQVLVDVLSGQLPMMSANATAQILELHRAGKVRILSVNAESRIKSAPEIPTSIESGLPGMVAQTTFGIFAPAGTPRPIVERLNTVTQQVMADAAFQNELLTKGFEPLLDIGPDKAASIFQDELVRWTPILKTVSTKPE